MQTLITAQEAKEISNSYLGRYMTNAMSEIKKASSIGNTKCQTRFCGSDEEIKQHIEKIKELGYNITRIADGSINEKYLTIEW